MPQGQSYRNFDRNGSALSFLEAVADAVQRLNHVERVVGIQTWTWLRSVKHGLALRSMCGADRILP